MNQEVSTEKESLLLNKTTLTLDTILPTSGSLEERKARVLSELDTWNEKYYKRGCRRLVLASSRVTSSGSWLVVLTETFEAPLPLP